MCNNKQFSFNELLEKDGSDSFHERNSQVLASEMYKISNGLSTPGNPFILRQNSVF